MTVRVRSIAVSVLETDAYKSVLHLRHRVTCIPQGSGYIINHSTRERQDSCTHSVPDKDERQTTTLRSVQVISNQVTSKERKTPIFLCLLLL